jgi:hypothetical protein
MSVMYSKSFFSIAILMVFFNLVCSNHLVAQRFQILTGSGIPVFVGASLSSEIDYSKEKPTYFVDSVIVEPNLALRFNISKHFSIRGELSYHVGRYYFETFHKSNNINAVLGSVFTNKIGIGLFPEYKANFGNSNIGYNIFAGPRIFSEVRKNHASLLVTSIGSDGFIDFNSYNIESKPVPYLGFSGGVGVNGPLWRALGWYVESRFTHTFRHQELANFIEPTLGAFDYYFMTNRVNISVGLTVDL